MRARPHRDWSLDDAMNGCFATHQGPTPTQPREEEKHPSSLEAERDIRHTPFPSRKRQTLAVDKKNTHTRQGKAAGIQSRGATQPTKSGAGNWFACPALLLPPPHPFPPNSRLDTPTTTRIPIDDDTHPTNHPPPLETELRNEITAASRQGHWFTLSFLFAGQVKVFLGTRTVGGVVWMDEVCRFWRCMHGNTPGGLDWMDWNFGDGGAAETRGFIAPRCLCRATSHPSIPSRCLLCTDIV